MNVNELIEKLQALPEDLRKLPVVVRKGPNHGGNYITRASDWVAKPHDGEADILLPDSSYMGNGYFKVLVLD